MVGLVGLTDSHGQIVNVVIRQELSAARCAIAVWSEQSFDSEWIHAEIHEARKQEKHLPIRIDESDSPIAFTQRTFQSIVNCGQALIIPDIFNN